VAMSGGVDSSVATALLKNQGYDCFGIFMHFWSEPGNLKQRENKCCSLASLEDARRVCQKLGIKLYILNFDQLFKEKIVDDFLKEYRVGKTPNPCVRCNKYIKFGELLKRVRKMGADYLATGHYISLKHKNIKAPARLATRSVAGRQEQIYKLFTARDEEKDQSYFLYNLTQEQLKYLLFPIGDYQKTEVRKLARKFGLAVSERRESQEVCFIPEKDHNEFLKRHLKLKPGKIVTIEGTVVGQHLGLPLYTVGQRRGVGLGGGPYYVVDFDYQKNQLLVATKVDDPLLFKDELRAKKVNWVSGRKPKLPLKCLAKIRYRHPAVAVEVNSQRRDYLVKFKKAQRAITSGQSVVFYKTSGRRTELLGGGIIG